MTKALSQHLEAIKEAKKGIFVPYIMAGDHEKGLAGLFETIDMMAKAGASAIEIGVPFSDPVADGPVIEAAGLRSLDKGTSLKAIIVTLQEKEVATPLILMTYFNPVYQYGVEQLIQDLHSTSVKGLIIPDLPYEHEDLVKPYLQGTAISLISLVSLTTGLERQKELVKKAQGFVYAVAVNGVTGKSDQYGEHLDGHLRNLREMSPVPVLTGFGVSSKKDIIRFNQVSDGVIVGSKIVRALYEKKEDEVTELISFGSHYQK